MQRQSQTIGFITEQGFKNLKDYKYKSGKYTWLDNRMNPYWEWVVTLIPTWVAPNLITFIGWLFVILSYANMLIYDSTFTRDIPSYSFFLAAACIFIYSTLDAVDGKQARRTKSSSPLGQLFDHGCDSFSITFFILAICQAAKLESTEVFLIFIACQTTFWTSNWMQYNTGILQTNVGQFGVTQGQYTCAIIHLITGILGQQFWQIKVSSLIPIELGQQYKYLQKLNVGSVVAHYFSGLLFLMCFYAIAKTIYFSQKKFKPIGEFFTLLIILIMEAIWFNLSIFNEYNGFILVNFGLVQSLIICKIIICSVTKMNFQYFNQQIIPLMITTIIMIGLDLRQNLFGQKIVFWVVFAINLIMICKFLYVTINQITKSLGIKCFSIVKDSKKQ